MSKKGKEWWEIVVALIAATATLLVALATLYKEVAASGHDADASNEPSGVARPITRGKSS